LLLITFIVYQEESEDDVRVEEEINNKIEAENNEKSPDR
jgi:ribosomal protein L31E